MGERNGRVTKYRIVCMVGRSLHDDAWTRQLLDGRARNLFSVARIRLHDNKCQRKHR